MRRTKKIFSVLLALCLMLGAVAVFTGVSADESAGTRKALRFSIDMSHEDFSSETYNQLSEDTYLAIMTTPFPVTSPNVDAAFKGAGDFLANWWEGIGTTFSVEYEYALSVPMQTMGSLAVSVDKAPWIFGTGAFDQNGDPAVDLNEDKAGLSNGWIKRTVNYDALAAAQEEAAPATALNDVYFLMGLLKKDLPESGTIDLYVRSMYFNFRGTRYAIYDSTDPNSYWIKAAKESFTSEFTTEFRYAQGASQRLAETTGNKLEELPVNDALHYGGTWSEVTAPTFVTLTESDSRPAAMVEGQSYDLTTFADTTGGTVTVSSVTRDGQPVEVTDGTAFVPAEAGSYAVTLTASGDYPSYLTVTLPCESADKPVFDSRDVDAAVPASAPAHLAVEIQKVKALVGGEKVLDTTLEVRKGSAEGEAFTVNDAGESWTFQPTAKEDATYFVRFKAVNEAEGETYTTYSDWKQVAVRDEDKPVFDFSAMFDSATVGTRYTAEALTDGLIVTDITDGVISDYVSVRIIDPTGKELQPTNGTYFIANSGKHTVIVVAKDSDGNTVTGEGSFEATPTNGCIIQTTYNIDESNRAAGVRKADRIHFFDLSPKALMFNAGAKLRFEVMAYTVIDGEKVFIPGVGGISGQLGSWEFIDEAISEDAVDNNGLGMRADADLSAALQDGNGNALWLAREYTVQAGDGLQGYQFYHLAAAIDTTAATGDQIFVFFRNLEYVMPDGETVIPLGSASDAFLDDWGDLGNVNVAAHNVSAAIDPYPVYLDGELPSEVGLGSTVHLTKYIMKDAYLDQFVLDISYTVTDPDGQPVELTESEEEYTFVASKRGSYLVTLVGTNDVGSTTVNLRIRSDDTEDPTLVKGTFSEIAVGQLFTATFNCADNVTAAADLEVEVRVFLGSTAVEHEMTYDNGVITVTFTPAEVGRYRMIVTVVDLAGRETTQEFVAEISDGSESSDPGDNSGDNTGDGNSCNGCGGSIGVAGSLLSVLALAGAALFKRK